MNNPDSLKFSYPSRPKIMRACGLIFHHGALAKSVFNFAHRDAPIFNGFTQSNLKNIGLTRVRVHHPAGEIDAERIGRGTLLSIALPIF
ncbi:hypothetical protein EDD55_104162 [Varunaivibrio sulfuroxidans]|uniref:Uncharacterized protein n=2 Tax=Varunaivibrio sulfuroxidans TaxID=1773489 RepID=A0A4V2UNR4_9PROT|nr:hypothetical protein EDD55_104162 [Varunaivibrio sulfuroxidans]